MYLLSRDLRCDLPLCVASDAVGLSQNVKSLSSRPHTFHRCRHLAPVSRSPRSIWSGVACNGKNASLVPNIINCWKPTGRLTVLQYPHWHSPRQYRVPSFRFQPQYHVWRDSSTTNTPGPCSPFPWPNAEAYSRNRPEHLCRSH